MPRQAADAAGSNGKSPATGQAAAAAPLPETNFKRIKPALQLVRPGAITAEKPTRTLIKKPSSLNDKTEANVSVPETAVSKANEVKSLLSPRPPAPLPVAAADATATVPALRAQRRVFRIPTLPPDALPSLSDLLLFEKFSISSLLARKFSFPFSCLPFLTFFFFFFFFFFETSSLPEASTGTLQKAPVPEAGSIFSELASFDSEALSQTAAELLESILPSYYEISQKKNHGKSNAVHGVIFGLSSHKTLRTYSQVIVDTSVLLFPENEISASAPIPKKKKSTLEENAAAAAAAAKNQATTSQLLQVPTYSNSQGVSSISSAVWVPTPGGEKGEEKSFFSEAVLRRTLAEDTEIPISFLKSLLLLNE